MGRDKFGKSNGMITGSIRIVRKCVCVGRPAIAVPHSGECVPCLPGVERYVRLRIRIALACTGAAVDRLKPQAIIVHSVSLSAYIKIQEGELVASNGCRVG